jgi:hypothetical protein
MPEEAAMILELRRSFLMLEQQEVPKGSQDPGPPLRRLAMVGVVGNPYAGQGFVADLSASIAASEAIGRQLSAMAVAAMGPHAIESYGKGAVVGLGGEQEHANAMLTTIFAEPLRAAVGGGLAWLPSFTKRGPPGTVIDVPLAHKDALYVRSHYDGMTLMLPDAPQADEVALIIVIANRGRIDARVGGLAAKDISRRDGLR